MSREISPVMESIQNMPESRYSFDYIRQEIAGDELLEDLMEEVENAATRYFQRVVAMEHQQIQKFRLDADSFRDNMERLDHSRRLTHNALCDKLRILARAAGQASRNNAWYEQIAGRNGDRYAIGQWALRTAFEKLYVTAGESNE